MARTSFGARAVRRSEKRELADLPDEVQEVPT